MIKSMTAFGRAEKSVEGRTYTVEMRSVNSRYCEISVRMPQLASAGPALEDRVKKLVAAKVSRGRVDVIIKVKSSSEEVPHIEVNLPLAEAYYRALSKLHETLGTGENVSLQTLLGLEGIITAIEPEVDLDKTWEALSSCVAEALEGINTMQISEGKAIYDEFQKRLQIVEEMVSRVRILAPTVLSAYQSRLRERIAVLTQGNVDLDPSRLAQEAAFLADKSDITEEIVRTESHLKQFRVKMESGSPVGRALDFLLQELNREVNTIGSKGVDVELAHTVVTLKSELEKIREQVQNVE